MEAKNVWKSYTDEDLSALEELSARYITFVSGHKTEREFARGAIQMAEEAGYVPLADCIEEGRALGAGDKVWWHTHGKALLLVQIGTGPIEAGLNILGAHIDSPRLDVKQNPLYEDTDLALLDTHYYGGIKKYQWTTTPLAIHGIVAKTDTTTAEVVVGEDAGDPVFVITDLLPHLGAEQMKKTAAKVVDGEALDVLVGGRPAAADEAGDSEEEGDSAGDSKADAKKDLVKARILDILAEKYGITEEDFLSAELEVVPAGPARELGFDRSMILAYGHDDSVCAWPSLVAQLDCPPTARTAVTLLVDKEEIGSVGATGMESLFFENALAEVMELAGEGGQLALRRALANSKMLSSDVSAGFDPLYASVYEKRNAAYLGRGLVFNKYTGSRGKSGSNDTSAEFVAEVRRIMDDAGVAYHTAELGRVDIGGGGTIAYIPARYGMDVIDSGVAVLNMHAPWEVASKADIFEAYKGYRAFLERA